MDVQWVFVFVCVCVCVCVRGARGEAGGVNALKGSCQLVSVPVRARAHLLGGEDGEEWGQESCRVHVADAAHGRK